MLESLDRDFAGVAFIVRCNKSPALRVPITETPAQIPAGSDRGPAYSVRDDGGTQNDVLPVRESVVGVVVLQIRPKNTVLGPDGIPARALARALDRMLDRLRKVLDASLAFGRFP